ncbi:MAG: DnaA regulatory inactivator Hda [Gammaproteobacteria bacterium]|nr:MAG: DnaA regulatory inactivator Hda [Gammaproteobacteria bacterium]
MSDQLPLKLSLRDSASFANYYPGPNREAVLSLHHAVGDRDGCCFYLWGKKGVGKSHLLQAICGEAMARGKAAAYFPLSEEGLEPAIMEGLGAHEVICVDGLEHIAGHPPWERALFQLYNDHRGKKLFFAARAAPGKIGILLPDLVSRLSAGIVWPLHPLSDEQRLAALQHRALLRGLYLPPEVGRFLLRQGSREMERLFAVLDQLDRASLVAQRRITLPFAKKVLGG